MKLNIVVDKIFEQGNFECNELLTDAYNELNRCLSMRLQNVSDDSNYISSSSDFINDFYIETCLRELIILWRHKILVLFKLLLIEKRVLFFGSPVKPVCATILSLISLHPQLLNKGLCNESEPKELTFQEPLESPVKSTSTVTPDKSPETEKSDDLDSLKQITILPSKFHKLIAQHLSLILCFTYQRFLLPSIWLHCKSLKTAFCACHSSHSRTLTSSPTNCTMGSLWAHRTCCFNRRKIWLTC